MIAIVDYGVGNLFSLQSSLRYIGKEVVVTREPETLRRSEKIILPGVGAFGDAARKLSEAGMDILLKEEAAKGKYLGLLFLRDGAGKRSIVFKTASDKL